MFLGILQAALYKNLNGVHDLAGWQWLFIVSGSITIFWGIMGLFVIPDSPATTRALWLSSAERDLARERMAEYGTTTAKPVTRPVLFKKLGEMVRSPVAWMFILAYLPFAWSQRANSYFLLYLKSLKKADGTPFYSVYKVNLIPLGGYSIAIVSNIGLNAISDWKQWRLGISVFAAVSYHLQCTESEC